MKIFKLFALLFLFANSFCYAQELTKHKVVAGETIYAIAKKYNVEVSKIYELNPKLKKKILKVNAVVFLPNNTKNESSKDNHFHKVERGESLYAISKKYAISIKDLESWNPEVKSNDLKIGANLRITEEKSIPVIDVEKEIIKEVLPLNNQVNNEHGNSFTIVHEIKPKETKYGIAKKYRITTHELEVLNPNLPADFPIGYQLLIKRNQEEPIAVVETEKKEEITNSSMSDEALSKSAILIDKASQFIGTRYRTGGTSENGFDCSGLMCTTFQEIDVALPRTSSDQANFGNTVSKNQAQKGDLIFFATGRKKRISHVGMITEVGDNDIKFIHSSSSLGVIVSSLSETYYATRFVKINRVLAN